MEFQYNDFIVELTNDSWFDPTSADNVVIYKKVHGHEAHTSSRAGHAIRVKLEDLEIDSAIVFADGGGSTVHEKCFVISGESLLICCGDTVFSLQFPQLDLNWYKQMDLATCFEIYEFKNDFIIHGEVDITRFTIDGSVKWSFSGRDIFVSPDGEGYFNIIDDSIIAKDFCDNVYVLNADGQVME